MVVNRTLHRGGRRRTCKQLALLGSAGLSVLIALGTNGAWAQSGPFVYVPNANSNSVSVIDTVTNTVPGPAISVGTQPFSVAVRGDELLVYVANGASNTVSVINTATNAVTATIPVGSTPLAVALSPNGTTAYVANAAGNTISIINTATNTVTGTIAVGSGPVGIAFSPNGLTAFVTNTTDSTVSVINTVTNTVTATIPVGAVPTIVAVAPNGATAYVANGLANTVSVINTATNTVTATIPVGNNATGIAVSPNGATAYVTNSASNTVSIINTATNTVIATVPVGTSPTGVVFSPNGAAAYVTNTVSSNTVSVIDTATMTVTTTIAAGIGSGPIFPGACGNGNALLAGGLTFKANTSGALACTLASGPSGAAGPIFTGGTMQFAGAGISSSLPITLLSQGGIFDTGGNNATLSGSIDGPGALTKIGLGTLTLSGTSTYAGPTAVNAGTLEVDGSIALSILTTVNNGGALTGVGTVGATQINAGGVFAPGNGTAGSSMTVSGHVSFAPGATYQVRVDPATASFANVTGTAALAGTVNAVFASGSYISKQYTILESAGLGGTTFSAP